MRVGSREYECASGHENPKCLTGANERLIPHRHSVDGCWSRVNKQPTAMAGALCAVCVGAGGSRAGRCDARAAAGAAQSSHAPRPRTVRRAPRAARRLSFPRLVNAHCRGRAGLPFDRRPRISPRRSARRVTDCGGGRGRKRVESWHPTGLQSPPHSTQTESCFLRSTDVFWHCVTPSLLPCLSSRYSLFFNLICLKPILTPLVPEAPVIYGLQGIHLHTKWLK